MELKKNTFAITERNMKYSDKFNKIYARPVC